MWGGREFVVGGSGGEPGERGGGFFKGDGGESVVGRVV